MDIQKKTKVDKILFTLDPSFVVDVYETTTIFEVIPDQPEKILKTATVIRSYYLDDPIEESDKIKELINKYREVFFP